MSNFENSKVNENMNVFMHVSEDDEIDETPIFGFDGDDNIKVCKDCGQVVVVMHGGTHCPVCGGELIDSEKAPVVEMNKAV